MHIFVPGRGYVDYKILSLDKAVKEYDERLFVAQNEETGDWCIYMKAPHGQFPIPIVGWRYEELPDKDEVFVWLWKHDSIRQGERLLDDINRHNDEIRKEREEKMSELTGEMAEHIEVVTRWTGEHPEKRIFVPKKDEDN